MYKVKLSEDPEEGQENGETESDPAEGDAGVRRRQRRLQQE